MTNDIDGTQCVQYILDNLNMDFKKINWKAKIRYVYVYYDKKNLYLRWIIKKWKANEQ